MEVVLGPDCLPNPPFREFHHRRVQESSIEPEPLRGQERRAFPRQVPPGAFETRLDDEHLVEGLHQVPLFLEDLPVLCEPHPVRKGARVFREQALLDDLVPLEEEAAEPCREEEHPAGGRPPPR